MSLCERTDKAIGDAATALSKFFSLATEMLESVKPLLEEAIKERNIANKNQR